MKVRKEMLVEALEGATHRQMPTFLTHLLTEKVESR